MSGSVLRRIVDLPITPAKGLTVAQCNMAIDSALLATTSAGDPPTLRFYRWPTATLSLGYFQSIADRSNHIESQALDLVRRGSGGGAIVHEHEWTYSLILPNRLIPNRRDATDWTYRWIHGMIAQTLQAMGLAVGPHGKSGRCDGHCDDFLCFRRRSEHDLILSGYKILGSAQRRGRFAVLQHGSLLINASEHAPQLPGVAELSGHDFDGRQWIDRFSRRLADERHLKISEVDHLWETVRQSADEIAHQKFASQRWRNRR